MNGRWAAWYNPARKEEKKNKKKEFSLCAAAHHMPGIRGPELGEGGGAVMLRGGHRKCERQSPSVLLKDFTSTIRPVSIRGGKARCFLLKGSSFGARKAAMFRM